MAIRIEDGTGHGYCVEITEEYQMRVLSEHRSAQSHASIIRSAAWQCVSGVQTVTSAGAYGIISIKNTGVNHYAITYIRIGIDAAEIAQAKIELLVGGTWVAGSEATSINMNTGSTLEPGLVVHYNSIPSSPLVADVVWVGPGPVEHKYNKEGSIILSPGKIISLRVTTETDNVKIHARVSLFQLPTVL